MTTAATPAATTENSAAPIAPETPVSSTPPANSQVTTPAEVAPVKPTEADGKVSPGDKPGDKPGDSAPKEGDAAKAPEVVPEKYDLKLSKDSLADQILVDKIADYAKSQGLSQVQAAELLANHEQAIAIETKARSEQWLKDAQNDPAIGGEKLKEASENTRRALKAFDPSGRMTKLVEAHGYGNHPAFIEFGNNVGKMLQTHGFILGNPGADAPKSHAEVLYGGDSSKS